MLPQPLGWDARCGTHRVGIPPQAAVAGSEPRTSVPPQLKLGSHPHLQLVGFRVLFWLAWPARPDRLLSMSSPAASRRFCVSALFRFQGELIRWPGL